MSKHSATPPQKKEVRYFENCLKLRCCPMQHFQITQIPPQLAHNHFWNPAK